MPKKRLVWQIFPTYLLVIIAALLAVTAYTTRSVRQFYTGRIANDLRVRAELITPQVLDCLNGVGPDRDMEALCKALAERVETRVTVITDTGVVVGDSHEEPDAMDNHKDRPEFTGALAGEVGTQTRFSHTLQQEMTYVAIPLLRDGEVFAALRLAVPITEIHDALWRVFSRIVLGGAVVAALAAAVSFAVSRRISKPLEDMRRGAERFAGGDLAQRLPVINSLEIGSLAEAMNEMACQLDDRLQTVVRQRNQLEAVLSSMVEGVLAVDAEEHILRVNQAAAQLLGIGPKTVEGKELREVLPHSELPNIVQGALTGGQPIEQELIFDKGGQRVLQVHATTLRDSQGHGLGAMVVLNDVTRLRRLEQVRRDFVANVSHELRTPITSIRGFVETLLDGAMNEPEEAPRFLQIVMKHADRLNAIIEDLLTLSRIEESEQQVEMHMAEADVVDSLRAAYQLCRAKAEARGIEVMLTCEEDIQADINAPLIEQALANLIDNAIKYSEEGGVIEVGAGINGDSLEISVRDHGCGIPPEHVPRLFERFYRVDKARSRRLGGTGLGLAIVKHIVQAHHGRVDVDSAPGEGTTFTLVMPVRAEAE